MSNLSFVIAFSAGLLSFLSPCVLPIVPGFLAYLAGSTSVGAQNRRRNIFLASVFFVLGFATVFALLGVLLNTILAYAAGDVQMWLSRIGGLFIIFFGLALTGLVRIPFFEQEFKINVGTKFSSRYVTAFVFGASFAAGWTPCVGPVLGAIIGLAAASPGSAFALFMVYALGLGLPFLVVGAVAMPLSGLLTRWGKVLHIITVVFGAILIIIGVLVFTERLSAIANLSFIQQCLHP